MFYFHNLDLNVNGLVSVKGCIYWGYGQVDLMESILLLLRPWMSFDYSVIQVVMPQNPGSVNYPSTRGKSTRLISRDSYLSKYGLLGP